MSEKTHYRKVFKSDHLGSADLEEFIEEKKPLVFTIKEVRQEYGTKVAGRSIDANIAYFEEKIKPLVLNATNSKIVKLLAGGSPFVQDWKGVCLELYIDKMVKMKGEVVGGVRIKEKAPTILQVEEINRITELIIDCNTTTELNVLYNSEQGVKTNQELVGLLRKRANELKQS